MLKTLLCLGDSYTIGEQVMLTDSFPYQTLQLLRKSGMNITAPEIIAKTGWTTDELNACIESKIFSEQYDFVTLLIGVNNQYRGREVENYKIEFEMLLKKAISFAGNHSQHVFVISIPDWGVTPFAEGRDRAVIAKEIDAYNEACEKITKENQCYFIDITAAQRKDAGDPAMIAEDGLHPSGKEYSKWAKLLSEKIISLRSS